MRLSEIIQEQDRLWDLLRHTYNPVEVEKIIEALELAYRDSERLTAKTLDDFLERLL